jgi:hypothetical protein
MDTLIQNNFFNVQTKTTNVLIEQQVIISEQELIDGFLDKINEVKRHLESLFPEYAKLIENTLAYIRKNETKETYIAVYENMHPLIEVTNRLILALSSGKFKECYFYWIEQYEILKSDLNEILEDLRQKIDGDIELSDLLNSIA